MRVSLLTALPILALLSLAPTRGEAQVAATIQIGPPQRSWGHEVVVTNYAPEVYGGWQTSYRHWSPVTVYYANGHYYPHRIHGARPVVIYHSSRGYFLPPHDQAWEGKDHRYNLKYRPLDDDYSHAPPPPSRPRP